MKTSKGGSFSDHSREREGGRLVYPVLARRSGGLSLGINLFPDRKLCSFDCPYCEVIPPSKAKPFSPRDLETELEALVQAEEAQPGPEPIRDICLSGNGEPSLSPWLEAALETCAAIRRGHPGVLGQAKLVIITNSTGFLVPRVAEVLASCVKSEGLEIWAKLDAGDEEGFAILSGSSYRLADIVAGLASFAASTPLIIQTMVCALGGREPSQESLEAYAQTLAGLLGGGAKIREVHLYTQARPAQGGLTSALSDLALIRASRLVQSQLSLALGRAPEGLPRFRVFGSAGEVL